LSDWNKPHTIFISIDMFAYTDLVPLAIHAEDIFISVFCTE